MNPQHPINQTPQPIPPATLPVVPDAALPVQQAQNILNTTQPTVTGTITPPSPVNVKTPRSKLLKIAAGALITVAVIAGIGGYVLVKGSSVSLKAKEKLSVTLDGTTMSLKMPKAIIFDKDVIDTSDGLTTTIKYYKNKSNTIHVAITHNLLGLVQLEKEANGNAALYNKDNPGAYFESAANEGNKNLNIENNEDLKDLKDALARHGVVNPSLKNFSTYAGTNLKYGLMVSYVGDGKAKDSDKTVKIQGKYVVAVGKNDSFTVDITTQEKDWNKYLPDIEEVFSSISE